MGSSPVLYPMSRTYRLIGYKNGKPQYTKNENNHPLYRWYKKDHCIARKKYFRAYRRKRKVFLKKFGEHIRFVPTNGWITN